METIEIEGCTLTLDEARDVVAWVDEPWRVRPACMLWSCADRPAIPRSDGDCYVELTPAIVEQLRDFVEPWTEVRRDEPMVGERVRQGDDEGMVTDAEDDDGDALVMSDDGYTWALYGDRTLDPPPIFVRRPRKPALTLGDAIGKRVERDGVRMVVFDTGPDAATLWVRVEGDVPGHLQAWSRDARVTLVEGDQ